jgi:hypothetical protein
MAQPAAESNLTVDVGIMKDLHPRTAKLMIAYHLRSAAFFLTVLFSGGTSAAALDELRSAASEYMQIHIQDDLLTLDAHDAPLSALLYAIGEEAGF